ncbi:MULTISPECIES: RNA polymerase sigma factor [Gimesia]|uniref:ECF RNA polymerase sigma-E factor n=2 Tax=Gimesia TaxID=1649453 RepID=A0A517PRK1_9PLAN|nr:MULTISPECIES: sigma-70 family RNA polymerase sigma factor [Gimesia]QDT21992.1 ECF RNA polymerase sigma-E factor [Gimesia chilikensis]
MASKNTTTSKYVSDATEIDAGLLERCRSKKRSAQQCLYELCHRQVYRLMVRTVGLQDAGDVTQQVFLQLFRKIDQFESQSKFETWLYRLAINEGLQHLRKGRRWNFQNLSHEPMSQHNPEFERIDHKELLEVALSRIEPELLSIFVLREVQGLSYREIAEVMEIPEGTVGSRLNRARRELQQQLADLGWEP